MYLVELDPTTLVYLTTLMDDPNTYVKSSQAMIHAHIRQQLAKPIESAKVMAEWKEAGAKEALAQPASPQPK
jgi:hypothetical protein